MQGEGLGDLVAEAVVEEDEGGEGGAAAELGFGVYQLLIAMRRS